MGQPKNLARVKLTALLSFVLLFSIMLLPGLFRSMRAAAQKGTTVQETTPPTSDASTDTQSAPTGRDVDPLLCCECDPTPRPTVTPIPFPDQDGFVSLSQVPVPEPDNLADFVRDRNAVIALGKALFWDMQAGSDGIVACASCHFHARADSRSVNQLNSGTRGGDQTFQLGPPNYTLTAADYPFHRLSDPNNRYSVVIFDANDVTSSQGVFRSTLDHVVRNQAFEPVSWVADPTFSLSGIN